MSSSSSSGTTNGGRTSGTTGSAADRSASAPPFSGITVAGDNSEFSERASTLEHSFVHRQVRSVSTLERDSGHIAGGGFETSSPGGRRPWHRRAREMLAEAAARAAEAAVASEREKLQQRGSPPATSAAAVTAAALEQKLREQPVRGLRPVRPAPEVSSSSSTQREAAAAPFIKAGASASSTSKQPPSRSGAQEHPQQRVQVTRLREDALQLLIEKGYTPTGDPDGGMSKMTPEEIEGFIPIGGSLGSILHESNKCAPCLFYSKNRCLRGIRCLFCHERRPDGQQQHEGLSRVKQRIRPSKRTRNLLRAVRETHPDLPPEEMMKVIQDYKKDIIGHHKKP